MQTYIYRKRISQILFPFAEQKVPTIYLCLDFVPCQAGSRDLATTTALSQVAAGGIARFIRLPWPCDFRQSIVSVALKRRRFAICPLKLSPKGTSGYPSEVTLRSLALCSLDFPLWRILAQSGQPAFCEGILACLGRVFRRVPNSFKMSRLILRSVFLVEATGIEPACRTLVTKPAPTAQNYILKTAITTIDYLVLIEI